MDFEQQLRTAFAPCKPRPELRATILARRSALGALKGKSRTGSRTLLVGTILAVAAAAAILGLHLADKSEPLAAVAPPETPAIEPVAPAEEVPLSVAQAAREPEFIMAAGSQAMTVICASMIANPGQTHTDGIRR